MATLTVTLTMTPVLDSGTLTFTIAADSDFDTGLLGDLFGALTGSAAGAIIGLIVGAFTGGLLIAVLIGAGIGLAVGVIAVEVVEYVVEGIVERQIKAKIDGEPIQDVNCCDEGVVHIARPASESEFNLGVLDAIPSSVSVHDENPEDELLYRDSFLVVTEYDEVVADADGFGAAGGTSTGEVSRPEVGGQSHRSTTPEMCSRPLRTHGAPAGSRPSRSLMCSRGQRKASFARH